MSKLKAGRTFDFVLEEFRGDPEADIFKLRVFSCEQDAECRAVYREALSLPANDERRQELTQKLLELAIAVNPLDGHPMKILTGAECGQIISAAIVGASLTSDERKKFVLPLTSEAATSAPTAEVNVPAK